MRQRAVTPLADGLVAGALASIPSGAPSTVHALLTGGDPLEATLAAGTLLRPDEQRALPLAAAALLAHVALSLSWGVALAAVLPKRATAPAGALAGVAIAALDLGLGRRVRPRIRALPRWPQVADHVAYGVLVGAVVARRRRRRGRAPGLPRLRTGVQKPATANRVPRPG